MSLRKFRRLGLGGLAAVATVLLTAAPSLAVVSPTPAPQWIPNDEVHALASDGTYVYIAGVFAGLNPSSSTTQTHTHLARINLATGVPDPSWNPTVNGDILAMTIDPTDSVVYIGGNFTQVNGVTRTRLAGALDRERRCDIAWNPIANFIVQALAMNGTQIVVAGQFSHIAGAPQHYLAQVTSTGALVASFRPVLDSGAYSLSQPPGASFIVVGGAFDTIGGLSAPYVGAVDLVTGANTGWLAANNCTSAPNHPCVGLGLATTATDYYVAISGPGGRTVDYSATTGQRKWTDTADGNCEVDLLFNGTVLRRGPLPHPVRRRDRRQGPGCGQPAQRRPQPRLCPERLAHHQRVRRPGRHEQWPVRRGVPDPHRHDAPAVRDALPRGVTQHPTATNGGR